MSVEQNLFLEEVYHGGKAKSRVSLPAQPTQNRLLAEALLEHSSTRHHRSPREWAISFSIHSAILVALLLVPLYFTQGIDMKRMEMTLLVAPLPPMAALPPPPAMARVVHAAPKVFTPGKLTAPTFIPKAVPVPANEAAPPEESLSGSMAGVPGGVPGGQIGGMAGGMPNLAAPVPLGAPAAAAEGPKRPVRVGGEVKPPRLIYGPAPVYPILANQSHVHGIVIIEAIIDERGKVVEEKIISGHPLLVQAALKAVSERRYEPTILDGEPTPVDLRVEVNFQQ